MQGLVFFCLSNARPWHKPVCPCWVLCPTGEEEDEGLTSLIREQISPCDPKNSGAGSPWVWGHGPTGLGQPHGCGVPTPCGPSAA